MKKIIYSFIASALLLTTAGCADLFDLKSPDQMTQSNYYRDQNDAETALAAVYAQLDGAGRDKESEAQVDWEYAEIRFTVEEYHTDLVYAGSDTPNYGDWMQLYNLTNNNANTQTAQYWGRRYVGILTANQVIEGTTRIPDEGNDKKIDPEVKKNIIAEARFLRALYHLQLQLNWRQIIVRDKATTAVDVDKALSKRVDSWEWILKELDECSNDLLQAQPAAQLGRATKNSAWAYLAWGWLNRAYENEAGDYVATPDQTMLTNALTAINKINGVDLVDNFGSMFDGTNKNSTESLLERQFSASQANGAWVMTRHYQWIRAKSIGGWDEIIPSQKLIDYLTKETKADGGYDNRAYATALFSCPYYNDPANFPYPSGDKTTFDEVFAGETRTPVASFRKLLPSTREELDMASLGLNIPLMRYSNVLLMKAEILAHQSDVPGAFSIINQIRAIHGGMPATTETDVWKAIDHERVMEFTLENSRFFDLRRWGRLDELNIPSTDGSQGRTFNAERNLYFPLPQNEILANGALQNLVEEEEEGEI